MIQLVLGAITIAVIWTITFHFANKDKNMEDPN
jgi:hypothetical protein